MYENQKDERTQWVTTDYLMSIAKNNTEGLDYSGLRQCIVNQDTLSKVKSDRAQASNNGVSSTPTIFVNGKKTSGNSYSAVKSAVQKALQ